MVIWKWFHSKYRIPHRTRDIPSTQSLPDLSTLRLQQPRKTGLWQTSPSPDLPQLLHSSRLRAAFTAPPHLAAPTVCPAGSFTMCLCHTQSVSPQKAGGHLCPDPAEPTPGPTGSRYPEMCAALSLSIFKSSLLAASSNLFLCPSVPFVTSPSVIKLPPCFLPIKTPCIPRSAHWDNPG